MIIRPYQSADCSLLAELFFHTVHTVNAKDYSKEQLDAWATGSINISAWDDSFLAHDTLVAEAGGIIVGFADMDSTGYLDRLYVHKNYQGQGIATALVDKLETNTLARGVLTFFTYASITAKPFFEKRGYRSIRENSVVRNTIALTNYFMQKTVSG